MEIQWDFKGFLKGLHKDGFHRIVMMILRVFLLGFYIDFYRDSRTCALDFTGVHTFSMDL